MNSRSVVVQIEHPKYGSGMSSGLQINSVVITHGSLLFSLLPRNCKNEDVGRLHKIITNDLQEMIQMPVSQAGNISTKFHVFSERSLYFDNNYIEGDSKNINPIKYSVEEARIVRIHYYKGISNIFKDSFNRESFENGEKLRLDILFQNILFLRIGSSSVDIEKTLYNTYTDIENISLGTGMQLIIESTPFCHLTLMQSWSHGIVSKLVGSAKDGILTDARLVQGCEGAPMYLSQDGVKGPLVGLVTFTPTWYGREWIGFSLGLSMKHLLQNVLQLQPPEDYIPFEQLNLKCPNSQGSFGQLSDSVVFVRCQHKWGSGVVIAANKNSAYILTCSHIVDHAKDSVRLVNKSGQFPASVVYSSPQCQPYDVALLTVARVPGLKALKISKRPPVLGEKVISAGYPMIKESIVMEDSTPLLSSGHVSKITPRGGPLQITCCTHRGNSGGAVIRPPDTLIGIVVGNLLIRGETLPTFGLAVSMQDLIKPIFRYIQTKDLSHLSALCVKNIHLQRAWSFQSRL